MPVIRVEQATAVPWSDVEYALTGGGDGGSCWCQWFTVPRKEFNAMPNEERRELLRTELTSPPPAPALVAYVDDEAGGWVRVAPRTSQPTLLRSRVVTVGSDEPPEDRAVWAVTCFVVRRQFRGLGVAKRLLEASVEHAASLGARTIEAYPIDTDVTAKRPNDLFVGTVRLFGAQGFVETARPFGARVVMTRNLANA